MTYSESKGKQPIDWNAFLNKEMEDVTKDEMLVMMVAAGKWVTCACGNQCDIIPRSYNQPVDEALKLLGIYFSGCVIDMWFDHSASSSGYHHSRLSAISTLHKIEKRSAEIINEIKNKPC